MAFDWAWEKGQAKDERQFKILQSSPTHVLARAQRRAVPAVGGASSARRSWASSSSSGTTSSSPSRPQVSVPHALAPGRGLLGPLPRRPGHHLLDAVPRRRSVQRVHALHRRRPPRRRARAPRTPPRCRATCSQCAPDESRAVACPLALGGVTFHHSKTPHMTPANTTDSWRRILTQHLQGRRRGGRGRPLPVEGLRQPGHRRAHRAGASMTGDAADVRWPAGQAMDAGGRRGRRAPAARFDHVEPGPRPAAGHPGRVVVTGLGKSGLVGAKLAATLAEHRHAGVLRARRRRPPRRRRHGRVRRCAARHLEVGRARRGRAVRADGPGAGRPGRRDDRVRWRVGAVRAGRRGRSTSASSARPIPHDLAPTTSTAVTAVVGDALAIALMVARGFGPADFHEHHPGGALGARLEGPGVTGAGVVRARQLHDGPRRARAPAPAPGETLVGSQLRASSSAARAATRPSPPPGRAPPPR